MQLKQALQTAIAVLTENDVGSPRLNAETLMMFVLGCNRAYLYAYPERGLTSDEQSRYEEAIAERARGVPAQYITGHQEFWGLDFVVTPAVLIPRPETEHLVKAAVEIANKIERPRIVDVGTGSGCVACSLANELPDAEVWAIDISEEALEIARANAARLQFEKVCFQQGDVLTGMERNQFDLVVSNPPYVGEVEADKVQAQVRKYEPHVAVFAGPNGFDIIRRLIPQAREVLKAGGYLMMEIGFSQAESAKKLVDDWDEVHFVDDLQGIPRVLVARKPAS